MKIISTHCVRNKSLFRFQDTYLGIGLAAADELWELNESDGLGLSSLEASERQIYRLSGNTDTWRLSTDHAYYKWQIAVDTLANRETHEQGITVAYDWKKFKLNNIWLNYIFYRIEFSAILREMFLSVFIFGQTTGW